MHTNSVFTRFNTENPFWYHQFQIKQFRKLRGGQPIADFDPTDKCRFYVTTMEAINIQDDIPSISIQRFKEHKVLVFDLTLMQQRVAENCY